MIFSKEEGEKKETSALLKGRRLASTYLHSNWFNFEVCIIFVSFKYNQTLHRIIVQFTLERYSESQSVYHIKLC